MRADLLARSRVPIPTGPAQYVVAFSLAPLVERAEARVLALPCLREPLRAEAPADA